ncbi:MAG: GNAT family N-acetyltransferase [Alphaproteobacteria bacterium]
MHSVKIFLLAILIHHTGFSAFSSKAWEPYRLSSPEKSQLSFETERLVAKPVTAESLESLVASGSALFSNSQILTTWPGNKTETPEDVQKWRNYLVKEQEKCAANLLSLRSFYLKSSPETFVGFIGCHRHMDSGHSSDGAVEYFSAFEPAFQRQNYAFEASVGILENDLCRLANYQYRLVGINGDNPGAIRLVTKLGYVAWDPASQLPQAAEPKLPNPAGSLPKLERLQLVREKMEKRLQLPPHLRSQLNLYRGDFVTPDLLETIKGRLQESLSKSTK